MSSRFLLVFLVFLFLGCNDWETKKRTVESLVAEQWDTIDSTEVDRYPAFPRCDTIVESIALKQCFEDQVYTSFSEVLQKEILVTTQDISDTIWVQFVIDHQGITALDTLYMSDTVRDEFPSMKTLITKGLANLPQPEPAQKQGVPVKTRFKMPVVIEVD